VIFGLRITLRCWRDDFGYPGDDPNLAVALERLIIRDFVRARRVDPDGSEGPIAALGIPFMKLKAGRSRGVTLWEGEPQGKTVQDPALPYPGVVWLLGSGERKEGDADDAYREFERLGIARLLPTTADYELLYADIYQAALDGLREDLERALKELLEEASREPGVLHRAAIESAELGLAVVVLDYAEYRVLVLPLLDFDRKPIPQEIHVALAKIVFDERRLDELIDYPDPDLLAEIGYEPGPFDLVLADLRERKT
jgi:hypothetical protein